MRKAIVIDYEKISLDRFKDGIAGCTTIESITALRKDLNKQINQRQEALRMSFQGINAKDPTAYPIAKARVDYLIVLSGCTLIRYCELLFD